MSAFISDLFVYLDATTVINYLYVPVVYKEITIHEASRRIADQVLIGTKNASLGWLDSHQRLDILHCSLELFVSIASTEDERRRKQALYFAAKNGFLEIVKKLVLQFEKDEPGFGHKLGRALCGAGIGEHHEIVKFLVAAGAKFDADDDDAICTASFSENLEMVKHFVYAGVNIERVSKLASAAGNLETVRYLISIGTSIDTALREASYNGHLKIVKYLVSIGANVHAGFGAYL